MRIGIDLRPMESHSKGRGIGYYNFNLFSGIISHRDAKDFIVYSKFHTGLPNILKARNYWKVPIVLRPIRAVRKFDLFVWFFWKLALRATKPQLVHMTSLFETYYLSVPDKIPTVVTIYDLIPLLFEKDFFQNERAKEWYMGRLEQAKKADKIITISESAKKDIQKILKISPEKIEVVYCGINKRFKPMQKSVAEKILRDDYGIETKYILSVASTTLNKNVPRIFSSFKKYIEKNKVNDLNLVVVCRLEPQEKADWMQKIQGLKLKGKIILTNFVPDAHMPVFYKGAECLLFPSLYEGFGLPVAEAMACGCPVITSNTSSLPEVGGEAVYYVDPYNESSIVDGISKLLNNKTLVQKLVKLGYKQAKLFNWKKSVDQTLRIYRKILEKTNA